MSQKKYCPKCGKPNEYINGITPVLCASCKTSFSAAFEVEVPLPKLTKTAPKKVSKQTKANLENESEEEFEDDEEFFGEIIVPRKFEVEINMPKRLTIKEMSEGKQANGFNLDGSSPSIFE